MLLPSHRDDHGEAAEICTEGMAVDGEGAEVLDELKQVRLASDLKVLRLAVQEESHLVHHVAVEEGKHSAKTEIRSHLRGNILGYWIISFLDNRRFLAWQKDENGVEGFTTADLANLDSWRTAVDENIALPSPNPDSHLQKSNQQNRQGSSFNQTACDRVRGAHQSVEEGLMPDAVNPELPCGAYDLDTVGHTVQDQLGIRVRTHLRFVSSMTVVC